MKPSTKALSPVFPPNPSRVFYNQAALLPHLSRYWLNAKTKAADPVAFAAQVRTICTLYAYALRLVTMGGRVISCDEMTGVQALERSAPTQPMQPGQPERREFEYIRHGTLSLMANFEIATGRCVAPSLGPTRTEADFAAHIAQTIDPDPEAVWVFVTDQLNTHPSESLVQLVAARDGLPDDLGVKGKSGVLQSLVSRTAFLSDPTHHIQFVYVPKHVVAQSSRDLAGYPGAAGDQAWLLHLDRRFAGEDPGLHRLLQPYRQTVSLDLHWAATHGMNPVRTSRKLY
jgi:hypothetical protein